MTTTERGWRVGHQGRDQMYYEERIAGAWQRIDVDGEMLTGRAHHVIYFKSPSEWQRYPAWAHGRRDEIIARIKLEFREPDYEYDDGGPWDAPAASASPPPVSPASSDSAAQHPPARGSQQGMGALFLASVLLLALGAALVWLALSCYVEGEAILPMQRATLRRTVVRAEEPATFWLAVGVYAALGAGAFTLGAFGMRERRRLGAR
jgi:hypothetical protein